MKKIINEPQANKALLRLVLLNKNNENENELKALTNIIRDKNFSKLPDAENSASDFIGKNPNSGLLIHFLIELGEIYSFENKWHEALEVYKKIQTYVHRRC